MTLQEQMVAAGAELAPEFEPELLEKLEGTAYRVDSEFSDTARFAEKYDCPVPRCLNAILVNTKREGEYHASLVLVPADARAGNKGLKVALVGKSSFAKAEDAYELTGMEGGAITPVGLPSGIPAAADLSALTEESYIVGGQTRDIKVEIPVASLNQLVTIDSAGLYE